MDTTNIKYDEAYIVKQYMLGKNQKELAKELGTYNTTIRRILLRNKVVVRSSAIANRFLDFNPFISTEADSEYFLGYLAADGNISSRFNRISLNTNLDPEILHKYVEFLGKGRVLKYFNKKYKVWEYSVGFGDVVVCDYLKSIGLTPRKSKTLRYKRQMSMAFIRGVFDGDGSIVSINKGKGLAFSIASASKVFAIQMYKYLKPYNVLYGEYNGMYFVRLYKKQDINNLYSALYENGSFFLERKKYKFGLLL